MDLESQKETSNPTNTTNTTNSTTATTPVDPREKKIEAKATRFEYVGFVEAFLIPPIPVYAEKGFTWEFLASIFLTLLCYFPGVAFALYVIISSKKVKPVPASKRERFFHIEFLYSAIFPPMAVFLQCGLGFELLLSLTLTILFVIPGILYAFYIVITGKNDEEPEERIYTFSTFPVTTLPSRPTSQFTPLSVQTGPYLVPGSAAYPFVMNPSPYQNPNPYPNPNLNPYPNLNSYNPYGNYYNNPGQYPAMPPNMPQPIYQTPNMPQNTIPIV